MGGGQVTAAVEEAAESSTVSRQSAAGRRAGRRYDLAVLAACMAGAFYLTWQMWVDPNRRVVLNNRGDQSLFEWLLTYAAHSVTHLDNPFWTTLLNAPIGVNLAVNTSMVVVGGLVAPITLTLGAPVAFLVVLTLNLILTPYAWYYVLSRHVTRTRAAAVLGGLFCGFAPGMVSHANAHLNFTGQFLVPFIVLCVLRLGEGRAPVRTGVTLGVLVVLEFSIGAEMLFFVALGLGLFVALWAWMRRTEARAAAPNFVRGLAAAGVVSLVLLAYPLYMEFAGPQRYHGIGFDQRIHSENLASYVAFPYLSLARLAGLWWNLAPNFTEETTFFGPLLLILAVACVVLLWRRPVVRAMAITGLVLAVLALGPRLHIGSWRPPVPLPYAALAPLPVFNSALPARIDLILIPIIGLLLAFALDRALLLPARRRNVWFAGFTVALLPIVPLPIPAAHRDPVPNFFTDGTWRQYIHSGQTLVPVPPPSDLLPNGQRWQTATDFGFAIPAGFFLGPGGPDGRSRIGPVPRPTYDLLTTVALTGADVQITDLDRLHAQQDLAYWHAKLIVLSAPGAGDKWAANAGQLRTTATELFGTPQHVDDVWLWRVP
jgi:hypothetical protein